MKFNCGCGWPGFYTNIPGAVYEDADSDGSGRREVMCAACCGHLGHVFRGENFGNPLPNERHCVNSGSLKFLDDASGRIMKPKFRGLLYPHE
jgi:peptide-methionine (R)-S-oxide reductase